MGNECTRDQWTRYLFLPRQFRPHHIAISATVLNKNLRQYYTQETNDEMRLKSIVRNPRNFPGAYISSSIMSLYASCVVGDGQMESTNLSIIHSPEIGTERYQVSYFQVTIDKTIPWILSRRSCLTCYFQYVESRLEIGV